MPLRNLQLPKHLRRDGWGTTLRRFGDLMDKYERISRKHNGGDVAYWYGERALTGLLAATVWQLNGGWSLEEFLGFRGSRLGRRAGRGDAWIGVREAWYTVEAKQVFVGATPRDAIRRVEEELADARKQLRGLHRDFRGKKGLALCYVIFDFSARYSDRWPRKDRQISDRIQQFAKERAMVVADYRPLGEPPIYVYKGANRVSPGVILVGQPVPLARGG